MPRILGSSPLYRYILELLVLKSYLQFSSELPQDDHSIMANQGLLGSISFLSLDGEMRERKFHMKLKKNSIKKRKRWKLEGTWFYTVKNNAFPCNRNSQQCLEQSVINETRKKIQENELTFMYPLLIFSDALNFPDFDMHSISSVQNNFFLFLVRQKAIHLF